MTKSSRGAVLLGIDVGSSSLKVAAFDDSGRILARGSRTYRVRRLANDRVEEDSEDWLALAGDLVREMLASDAFQASQVAGVGLSGRGGGVVFVGDDGKALCPVWLDRRSADQARRLTERFGPLATWRGVASQVLYLSEQHRDLFRRLAHPLISKDYLLYRLTGVAATDPTMGPLGGQWPSEVWSEVGFPIERLPAVRPHTDVVGALRPTPAAALGLPAGIPVGIGSHDGGCANVGTGALDVGEVCLTLGTTGVVRAITAQPAPTETYQGFFVYHFLPGRWACGGDAAYAGHSPTWLARLLQGDHLTLEAAARGEPPGSGGVTFLPYLAGEISPSWRPDRRAAFVGLADASRPGTLYRAVLEGAAVALRLIADQMSAYGLLEYEDLIPWRVSGGGANNRLWLEILSATLGKTLVVGEPEECARGAAMLVAVGLGLYPTIEECAVAWVRPTRVVVPDPVLAEACEPVIRRFRRLSEAVYSGEQ